MDFLLGVGIGIIVGMMFFGKTSKGSMPAKHKEIAMKTSIVCTRMHDYLEEQERQGNVKFSDTQIAKDYQELEDECQTLLEK